MNKHEMVKRFNIAVLAWFCTCFACGIISEIGFFQYSTWKIDYDNVNTVETEYTRGDLHFEPNVLVLINGYDNDTIVASVHAGDVHVIKVLNNTYLDNIQGFGISIFTYGIRTITFDIFFANSTPIDSEILSRDGAVICQYIYIFSSNDSIGKASIEHELFTSDATFTVSTTLFNVAEWMAGCGIAGIVIFVIAARKEKMRVFE